VPWFFNTRGGRFLNWSAKEISATRSRCIRWPILQLALDRAGQDRLRSPRGDGAGGASGLAQDSESSGYLVPYLALAMAIVIVVVILAIVLTRGSLEERR